MSVSSPPSPLLPLSPSLLPSHHAVIKSKLVSKFAVDPKGIYFVLAASDVTTPGLCSLFCGYHAMLDLSASQRINYVFLSNVERCLPQCGIQQ